MTQVLPLNDQSKFEILSDEFQICKYQNIEGISPFPIINILRLNFPRHVGMHIKSNCDSLLFLPEVKSVNLNFTFTSPIIFCASFLF